MNPHPIPPADHIVETIDWHAPFAIHTWGYEACLLAVYRCESRHSRRTTDQRLRAIMKCAARKTSPPPPLRARVTTPTPHSRP